MAQLAAPRNDQLASVITCGADKARHVRSLIMDGGLRRHDGGPRMLLTTSKSATMPPMSEEDLTSLRLRIEGFVQAVGYRNFAIEEARRLGLDGWIRNRSDGTVEVLCSGDTKKVEAFVAACMRGPRGSRVTNVELHNAEPPADKGFHRRPSL